MNAEDSRTSKMEKRQRLKYFVLINHPSNFSDNTKFKNYKKHIIIGKTLLYPLVSLDYGYTIEESMVVGWADLMSPWPGHFLPDQVCNTLAEARSIALELKVHNSGISLCDLTGECTEDAI